MALGLFVALLMQSTSSATAKTVIDSAGRPVDLPARISRVFAAGPPAAVLLYVLAPQTMIGWPHAPRAAAKTFLLPTVRDLPELGALTGRGQSLDLEPLVAAKPDLIIDFGSVNETYRSLADRVQAQTGIPYLLIDGRLDNTAAALRLIGELLGVKERGEELARAADAVFAQVDRVLQDIPKAERPRIYFARGADGLDTRPRGTLSTEIIARVGAIDVVDGLPGKGGRLAVTLQQLSVWAPDAIITLHRDAWRIMTTAPGWAALPAVQTKRVFLAPDLPFGFIDTPPSLNRLIGLTWLLHQLYPEQAPGGLLFYQVDLSDQALNRLLGGVAE